ncbi:MAG: SH3 domain-containing protein [Gammaproteobacteria bacterium]
MNSTGKSATLAVVRGSRCPAADTMPRSLEPVTWMKNAAVVPAVAAFAMVAACGGWPTAREPPPTAPPETAAAERATATTGVVARDSGLEQKLARSELLLLEKESQIEALQARLDDARQEVVRVMARQQSQASRAEAASAIAEAEIALQSLNAAGGGPGATEVDRLIRLASAEFDRQNYAGALYMAGQAKGAAFSARGQVASSGQGLQRAGDRPFASPLRLQTSTGANVREGPGSVHRVLFTLPAGAAVTGLSQADEWVRITDPSGRAGWIHQSLIGRRR